MVVLAYADRIASRKGEASGGGDPGERRDVNRAAQGRLLRERGDAV